MLLKADAVFEGGGVKGIGLVGAAAVAEAKGYQFENLAGTSAGAIVASLIAAGYKADDLKKIIEELDYNKFKDKGFVDKIPVLGVALSLGFEKGIYEGDFFESWLRDMLVKAPHKPIKTFYDLRTGNEDPKYRYKLQVIAADISRGRMLVLPKDIVDYGKNPDELDVAFAVRMSMSIPFFYEPVILNDKDGRKCYIVDGGILSNYPVWLFDVENSEPSWPTFGFKLVEPEAGRLNAINGPITLFAAMFNTMMEAHDNFYIEEHNFVRTIAIPTCGVQTTEFDLSREKSDDLYKSGINAATEFFKLWDFDAYKKNYRQNEPLRRRERIWKK